MAAVGIVFLLAWASNPVFAFFGENQGTIQNVAIFLLGVLVAWLILYNQMKAKKILDPKLALNLFATKTSVGKHLFPNTFMTGDIDNDYSKYEIATRGNHTAFRAVYGVAHPGLVLDNSFTPDDEHTSLLLYVPKGEGKSLKEMLDAIALDQEMQKYAKIGENVINRKLEKESEGIE